MMAAAAVREQSLSELLAGIAEVPAGMDIQVRGVETDSRRLQPGAAFLACTSHDGRRHGLDYLEQAIARKPAALLWEPAGERQPDHKFDLPALAVADLTRHVSELAARSFGHPSSAMQVVGVTGTDGKTSVAHLLAQAWSKLGGRCGYLGTLGYGELTQLDAATHTTPDSVALQRWLADMHAAGVDSIAMEVSSHALDQHRVDGVAFDVALLTNLGRDHLDYHGNEADYHAAKRRLFEMPGLSAAVLNQDDAGGAAWLTSLQGLDLRRVAYGTAAAPHPDADEHVLGDIDVTAGGLMLRIRSSYGDGELQSRLLGRFNGMNLLAALTVLLQREVPMDRALAVLAELEPVPGRMQVVGEPDADQPLVVVDYAHTPQALEQALRTLREHCGGRLICVFGCGGDRDRGKRPLMAAAAEALADELFVTDDNPRSEKPQQIVDEILAGLSPDAKVTVEHDRRAAIGQAIAAAGPEDIVLVAGKGHEDYQLIGDQRLDFDDRVVVQQVLDSFGSQPC